MCGIDHSSESTENVRWSKMASAVVKANLYSYTSTVSAIDLPIRALTALCSSPSVPVTHAMAQRKKVGRWAALHDVSKDDHVVQVETAKGCCN